MAQILSCLTIYRLIQIIQGGSIMAKKKMFLVVAIVILVACIVGGVFMIIIKNKSPQIKTFNLSEYQYFIDNFSSEDCLGSIFDSKELLKKVESIWIKKFGERVKAEKPYQIFYDEQNGVWLVQGTLPADMMGGVANIIVENNTGKVLALWHEK